MVDNEFESNKIKERKVLHKVKKNWIVLSLSFFGAFGIGGFIDSSYVVHADTQSSEQVDQLHTPSPTDSSGTSNASKAVSNADPSSTSDASKATSSADPSSASDASKLVSSTDSSGTSNASNSASNTNSSSTSGTSKASSSADSSSASDASKTKSLNSSSSNSSNDGFITYVDPTKTVDSYSANDGTGIQNINDFDYAITLAGGNYPEPKDAPDWVNKIDPMGKAWAPLINQYIKNNNYIVIPPENISNAKNLFNDYINKYGLSSNYTNYEQSKFSNQQDFSIGGAFKTPAIQSEDGLKNVAGSAYNVQITGNYSPSDKLQLFKTIVQNNIGNGGVVGGGIGKPANSDSIINANLQSLEPYAGHYEAPTYYIVTKDLSNSFATYTSDDGTEKQATIGFPLDYLIFLHPQVFDQNGNKITDDLTNAPIFNINYVYNSQTVGNQQLFAVAGTKLDASSLTPPIGYSIKDKNSTVDITNSQTNYDVEVIKDSNVNSLTPTSSSTSSSYTYTPSSSVASDAPFIFYSAPSSTASSATSTSSSSASSASVAPSAVNNERKMYNHKTQLIKQDGQVQIYIEPKYAANAANGSLADQYVVTRHTASGKIKHNQLVTLEQYNAMLTASGKQTFTSEELDQAYSKRKNVQGVMRDKVNKTTFDAKIVAQGNDTLLDISGANYGFNQPTDKQMVLDTDNLRVPVHNTKPKKQHKIKVKAHHHAKKTTKHAKVTHHTKHTHHIKHDHKRK